MATCDETSPGCGIREDTSPYAINYQQELDPHTPPPPPPFQPRGVTSGHADLAGGGLLDEEEFAKTDAINETYLGKPSACASKKASHRRIEGSRTPALR
jgi:hypothetical protein